MENDLIEEIYRKYSRQLYIYALSLVHNRADAEDLVSETFIRAFLSLKRHDNLQAWLYTVLRNLFFDEMRRRKHVISLGEQMLAHIPPAGETDRTPWLYEKINALKQPDREIMILTLTSGLNDEQIAELVHMTKENVRVIRHRTKQKLKELAQKEGYSND